MSQAVSTLSGNIFRGEKRRRERNGRKYQGEIAETKSERTREGCAWETRARNGQVAFNPRESEMLSTRDGGINGDRLAAAARKRGKAIKGSYGRIIVRSAAARVATLFRESIPRARAQDTSRGFFFFFFQRWQPGIFALSVEKSITAPGNA